MAKSIKDLREEKGYRSAREFAEALGIAASSMSRYDRDPETIPMKHAIAMADLLECSVDEIVGRTPVTSGRNELQEFYDGLLPETRALMDEFIEFVRAKDEKARRQRQDEQDRKYDDLCRYYQRMFYETAYEGTRFGELVAEGRALRLRELPVRAGGGKAQARHRPALRGARGRAARWIPRRRRHREALVGRRDPVDARRRAFTDGRGIRKEGRGGDSQGNASVRQAA